MQCQYDIALCSPTASYPQARSWSLSMQGGRWV